jgi:hypothetical protein
VLVASFRLFRAPVLQPSCPAWGIARHRMAVGTTGATPPASAMITTITVGSLFTERCTPAMGNHIAIEDETTRYVPVSMRIPVFGIRRFFPRAQSATRIL